MRWPAPARRPRVNPLYFGASGSPLYGVYHPPKSRQSRETGLVLCAPFGQEYMRAHRAFRQLALMAARAGFHVLRFDYTGTGDSTGDGERFSIAQSVEDTELAVDELRAMGDVEHVALLGLRLGGLIAARAATRLSDVSHPLWDPVVSGAGYLEELLSAAREREQPFGNASGDGTGVLGVMGFPVTEALRSELRTAALPERGSLHLRGGLVMSSEDTVARRAIAEQLSGPGKPVAFRHEPVQGRWDEVDNWGSAMIPQAAIQSMVSWLAEEVE